MTFNQTTNGTYAGVMSGTGTLTKSGTGNVTLSGTNTYSGGTTISAGTLTGTTDSLQGNIANDANVIFDQSHQWNLCRSYVRELATLTKANNGDLTLSGTNTYSGGTTVSAGSLTGTTTSLQGDIVNNANVTFNQLTNGTYAGMMSGSGSLTLAGSGTRDPLRRQYLYGRHDRLGRHSAR